MENKINYSSEYGKLGELLLKNYEVNFIFSEEMITIDKDEITLNEDEIMINIKEINEEIKQNKEYENDEMKEDLDMFREL